MRFVVWVLILVLLCLHQDYWQWGDTRLVLGFAPYSLAYHTVLSVASAALWLLAVTYAWPRTLNHRSPAEGEESK